MRTIIVMLVAVGSRSCSAAAQSLQLLLLASGTIMAAFLRFGAFGAAGFQTQGCRTDANQHLKYRDRPYYSNSGQSTPEQGTLLI